MKKVLLVNANTEKSPYPVPPLGLCLLAEHLKSFYNVAVYDGTFDEGKSLCLEVERFKPDYIGFSIRNIDDVVADCPVFYPYKIMQEFIDPVRNVTDRPLILGGSGFSIFPGELMHLTGADYGISGEGEETFLRLLQRLDHGHSPAGMPNIWCGAHTPSEKTTFLSLANASDSCIDQKIDFEPYRTRGVYSIQTKRGCALGCIYCTYPCIEGTEYRFRHPDDIAREIRDASERLGDIVFEFVDSTFNEPPGHAEAVCEAIIRSGSRLRLRTMGINPRHTNKRLFQLMQQADFMQIDVTPDSASAKMIRNLRKGFTMDDIRRTAGLIRETNMPTMWFFLFGGPGETMDTFLETINFIDEFINPEDLVYLAAGLRIYPGTPLWKRALRDQYIKPGTPLFYPPVFYFSPEIGKEKLNSLIREAAATRYHCLPPTETTPDAWMLEQALTMRREQGLQEPMFRTLLRIRKNQWMKGKR